MRDGASGAGVSPNGPRTDRFAIRLTGVLITLGALVLSLCSGEIYFRFDGRFASWAEKNHIHDSGRSQEKLAVPWIWLHPPSSKWKRVRTEFVEENRSNEEGWTGELPPLSKRPGETRIAILGDSYTEGVGDSDGDGFPGYLRRELSRTAGKRFYTVINAGASGSDPIFGLEILRRRVLKYRPDLVVQVINSTDNWEVRKRGGMDRFDSSGGLRPAHVPLWTPLFDRSHLVRAFLLGLLRYDWSLSADPDLESRKANIEILESIRVASREAAQAGARYVVFVHPVPMEIIGRGLRYDLATLVHDLEASGIKYINALPDLIAMGGFSKAYYWPIDSHFNHRGYELLGATLLKALRGRRIVP